MIARSGKEIPMRLAILLPLMLALAGGAFAMSPAPEPKPALGMLEAIQKAKVYAEARNDLSRHYLDRVWLGRPGGENERKWIVSWSPDGMDTGKGWVIVTVDMEGNVSVPKDGVSWIDRRTIDAIRESEDAKKALEKILEKPLPKGWDPEKSEPKNEQPVLPPESK